MPTGTYRDKNISNKRTQRLTKWIKENGAWNKGLTKYTDVRVAKYVKSMQETKKGEKCPWLTTKGLKFPEDEYPNHGMRGKRRSLNARLNTSKSLIITYENNPSLRLKRSQDMKGENHWNWKGGVTNTPYPSEFSEYLKRKVRKRYNYVCQICERQQEEKKKLDVHHIDGNKDNNILENLISLCASCHTKVGTGGLSLDA